MHLSLRRVSGTAYLTFVCLSGALLGGCASGRGTQYEASADTAYLMVAASGIAGGIGLGVNGGVTDAGFTFWQFDVDKQAFLPKKYLHVSFERLLGDKLSKPASLQTDLTFGGKAVPPGDYAITSRYDIRGHITNTCFSLGTQVYRIRPGHVNVVYGSTPGERGSVNLADIERQTREVLAAGYPKITAPVVAAEIIGRVEFGTQDKSPRENCNTTVNVKYTPAR